MALRGEPISREITIRAALSPEGSTAVLENQEFKGAPAVQAMEDEMAGDGRLRKSAQPPETRWSEEMPVKGRGSRECPVLKTVYRLSR